MLRAQESDCLIRVFGQAVGRRENSNRSGRACRKWKKCQEVEEGSIIRNPSGSGEKVEELVGGGGGAWRRQRSYKVCLCSCFLNRIV